ncbi:exported hypothetical protein [Capnocytophaga canis]|nr:exported hypothetical protein [Capnocytophaga canis]
MKNYLKFSFFLLAVVVAVVDVKKMILTTRASLEVLIIT